MCPRAGLKRLVGEGGQWGEVRGRGAHSGLATAELSKEAHVGPGTVPGEAPARGRAVRGSHWLRQLVS